jgi:uncharacterized protein YwqG
MATISNNLFTIEVPDGFEVMESLAYLATMISDQSKGTIDKPRITLALNKLEYYDNFAGNDLLAKVRKSILESRFQAQESSSIIEEKNGRMMYVVHSFTKATFQKVDYDFIYYDAVILINELYCVEFAANFEKVDEADFTKIYTSVFDSLEWKGTVEDCVQYFAEIDRKLEEIYTKYPANQEVKEEWARPIVAFDIPSDGEDICNLGGLDFEILQEESSVEIDSHSKELYVTILAVTKEVEKGENIMLLDINDYLDPTEKGKIKISFPMLELYKDGIPTGSFIFKEDKCEQPYASMQKNGFEYSLDFFGVVTFEKGWVGINGYLKAPYNEQPVFDVKIYKQFEVEKLDWSNYTFKSLEEALQAPRDIVQWLQISNPTFDVLPDVLFEFKNLKSFGIVNTDYESKLPLHLISDRIGELTELDYLNLSNTSLTQLPGSIGKLQKLTGLYVMNSQLTSIPSEIMKLPNLLYISFDNNALTAIPEDINLPSCYSVSLSKNLLTSLPESLATQLKITSIKCTKNPLESLPSVYNDFNGIELDIADKLRLLDYEYRGADKKGIVAWDDRMFYLSPEDELYIQFHNLIIKHTLTDRRDVLLSFTKHAIGFEHSIEDDYSQVGGHRSGGWPDLPMDVPYPTFIHNYEGETEYKYEFIGQINCGAIAHLQNYLPRKGMLYFFLETLHNLYGGQSNPCKVMYIEDEASLASGKRFDFQTDDFYEMFELYRAFKVKVTPQLSLPAFYSIYTNAYLLGEKYKVEDFDDEKIDSLEESFRIAFPYDYAINSYGFTQHESPELQASLRLRGRPEDWTILLKVASAGDMQWGDAGELFFVIHKSDLAKGDFSNIFVTMESS